MSILERLLVALVLFAIAGTGAALVSMALAADDVALDEAGYHLPDDEGAARAGIVRREAPDPAPMRMAAIVDVPDPEPRPVTVVAASATSIVGTIVGPDELPVVGAAIASTLHFPDAEVNYGVESEHEARAVSDDDGRFRLDVPGHGAYRVLVQAPGFEPHVVPKARAGEDLVIALTPGATLIGTVTVAGGTRTIAGAAVTVRKLDSPWTVSTSTNELGVFRVEGAYLGDLYVTILHDLYVPLKDVLVQIAAPGEHEQAFPLDPGKAIRGTVVDPRGQPVENAVAIVGEKRVATDMIGAFKLSGLASEGHHVVIEADGFLTYGQNVNLSGSRDEAVVAIQLAEGGTVRGSVIDETGKPIVGAELKVFRSWGNGGHMSQNGTRFVSTSDENGLFAIKGLHVGGWMNYVVRARAEGYADAYSDEMKIADVTKPIDVQIVVGAGGAIRGKVLDEKNQPIVGAKLALNPDNVYEWSEHGRVSLHVAISGEDGSYAFSGLGPRKYRISAVAPGFASQYKSGLEIRGAGELDGTDFMMEEGERIEGSVKNEDGEPLPGARIWMYSQRSYAQAVTDESGNYVIDKLSRGPFYANAWLDGYSNEQKRDVYPVEGRIDFELKRNGYVWGDVVDKVTGKPVRKLSVTLWKRQNGDDWQQVNGSWTDDPTGTFKLYAADGTYKLTISSKGYLTHSDENVSISVSGKPEPMNIELVPGGALEGWVHDHLGRPVPHVQIYVWRHGAPGEKRYEQRSSSEVDGYFYVDALEAGTYDVAAYAWGTMPLQVRPYVTIVGGDLGVLRLEAAPISPLRVRVVEEDGKPVDRAQVKIETLGSGPIGMDYAEWRQDGVSLFRPSFQNVSWLRNGQPRIWRDLPAGRYRLTVTRHERETVEMEITLEAGKEVVEEVKLLPVGKKPKPEEGTPAGAR